MSLPLTNLDDRRWADLVKEGRSLIPVYAPDWTDHNIHDPGITLMELFAWIAEGDIYRVNRIPESHRLKFLALVGVRPKPPRGSRSIATFSLRNAIPAIHLPTHVELQGINSSGQTLTFRTDDKLNVVPGRLASIQVYDGDDYVVVSASNSEQVTLFIPFEPLGEDPNKSSIVYFGFAGLSGACQLTLYFDVDGCLSSADDKRSPVDARPCPDEELRDVDQTYCPSDRPICCVTKPDSSKHGPNPIVNDKPLEHHSVRLIWEVGTANQQWQPLPPEAVQDNTRSFTRSGQVQLALPKMKLRQLGRVEGEFSYLRCRIACGQYDVAPKIRGVFMNSVPIEQTESAGPSCWRIGTDYPKDYCVKTGQKWLPCVEVKACVCPGSEPVYVASRKPCVRLVLRHDDGRPVRGESVRLRGIGVDEKSKTDANGIVRFNLQESKPATYTLEIAFLGRCTCHRIHYCPTHTDRICAHVTLHLYLSLWLCDTDTCLPVLKLEDCGKYSQVLLDAVDVGVGTGLPRQEVTLPDAPVAGSSLRLFTFECDRWRAWDQRDNFCSSGRSDSHFLLGPQDGSVQFGDGERGRVVPDGAMILATYLRTHGAAGILSAQRVDSIRNSQRNEVLLGDLKAIQCVLNVTNPLPATGGADLETLVSAASRAVKLVQTTDRAVTLEDYKRLAMQTPGVCLARVEARANEHPAFQCITAHGVVTVIVLPCLPRTRPFPTRNLLRCVSDYLDRRRVLGTRVEVVGPEYVRVTVKATIRACPRVDPARLSERIEEAIKAFFHPLTGGPKDNGQSEGKGWPFGRDVYRSELLQVIDETPGTDYVESLEFEDADGNVTCGNVCVPRNGLVESGDHAIQVTRPIR